MTAEGAKPDFSGDPGGLEIFKGAFKFGNDYPFFELEFHGALLKRKIWSRIPGMRLSYRKPSGLSSFSLAVRRRILTIEGQESPVVRRRQVAVVTCPTIKPGLL
jgi:hypothetical protein